MNRYGGLARACAAAMAVFAVDRITKLVASAALAGERSVPIVPGMFHLTLVHNNGAAFGVLQDQRYLFIAISLVALACIIGYLSLHPSAPILMVATCGLVAGGTLGNLLDRIKYGYVIDFLDLRVWPVFNVADTAITVGIAILAVSVLARQLSGRPAGTGR